MTAYRVASEPRSAKQRTSRPVAGSQARYTELYARVEQRLRPDDHPLLRELFEAITRHHERFEHAAYLVGLQAGNGTLSGLPPVLGDDRTDDDDGPRRA